MISDGLNYLNANEYNSFQSINVIGVGLVGLDTNSRLSLKDAEIFDDILTYKIDFNDFNYDNLKIDLRNSDSLVHFENFNLISKSGIYIDSLDVSNLNLSKYSELNIGVNINDDNVFNNYVNVFQNSYNLKNISLITGIPSLNTKYIKEKLNYLNDNIYHAVLEDDFDIDYDNSQLIVFDNYPNNTSQIDEFNSTIIELKKNNIPFIIVFGPNQDYNIINKVSNNFEFSISNEVQTELVFSPDVIYNDSKLSQFMPPISYYKILSESQNLNNIYYSNFSPAILFENNYMFVFCPYLSQISYKLNDNKDSFDNLFESLFKQIYYQEEYVRLFTDRNNFYNYENIKIKLKDNAGIQYDDLLLKIKDSNNNLYAQYSVKEDDIDKYIVPPIEKAGTYYLYLLNNNQKVSNKLTISIYNYDNEDILKGQNVEYLKKVATKTNGLYSNEENFLANLKNNTINYKINYNKDIYDAKDYLLVLLIAILALIVDWYLRKKRGLL